MIHAESLTRKYGDFTAVKDVSFDIGHGEIVGLLGHNGAGKTTIMKMLTGYLEPTDGRIEIDGIDIGEDREAVQQRIGYLPENCPLYPEMTVVEFLEYAAALHDVPENERPGRIREAIRLTELEDKALAPIATLSRGYRQRTGVAQAILHRPKILILDEPTNGLDPTQILHMRDLIRTLAKDATVILSTHILQEVQAVCERVMIIRDGRLALDARMDALGRYPRWVVVSDAEGGALEAALRAVPGVRDCRVEDAGDGRRRALLDVEREAADALGPKLARRVIEQGWALFELYRERRDLETIFGEISNGGVAGHA
ncbi:MAG: ABC transporter ATP-binding protein [Gammaproteobacteria bacterium]|nr:MAG: ABC transporter ATP-binding protein [Gammaproteobacteria bacterium]